MSSRVIVNVVIGGFVTLVQKFLGNKRCSRCAAKRDRETENKNGTFVNGSHYAKFRRFVYERHCKMYNTDYNAVVIDWDLFGEFCEKKEIARSIVKKVKHISVKSTYDPILNQRLVFK